MYFVRAVAESSAVIAACEQWEKRGDEGLVPVDALREFIPSAKDKGWLSVFEVAELADARQVAAASTVHRGQRSKQRRVFLAAEVERFKDLGLQVRANAGAFSCPTVDGWHREIEISTYDDAVRLARLFLNGEIQVCEPKDVGNAATDAARTGAFVFAKLAEKPESWSFLRDYAIGGIVQVSGSASQ